MKMMLWIILTIFLIAGLFAAGFAAGFPYGRNMGFSLGSEWVMMQIDMLAREEGIFMPIRYEEGQFRVLLKQPNNVYRRAWKLADRYEEEIAAQVDQTARNRPLLTRVDGSLDPAGEHQPEAPRPESVGSLFQASHNGHAGEKIIDTGTACTIKDITL